MTAPKDPRPWMNPKSPNNARPGASMNPNISPNTRPGASMNPNISPNTRPGASTNPNVSPNARPGASTNPNVSPNTRPGTGTNIRFGAGTNTRPRKSMAKRISNIYMQLFSRWMNVLFFVLLLTYFGLYGFLYYEHFDHMKRTVQNVENFSAFETDMIPPKPLFPVNHGFLVTAEEGRLQVPASFSSEPGGSVKDIFPMGHNSIKFTRVGYHVWFSVRVDTTIRDGTPVQFHYAQDITFPIAQGLVLFIGVSVLFGIASLIMGFQGRYATRKALRTIDDFTQKISAISSQNLNLRMNVRESTDELVDLAVTFNKMMERLEVSYEKQNRFVSDASHELRTPISVIQGYARMLERWGKNDAAILDESISAISNESKNMQDLVEKLLFIARNDRDKLVLTKEPFNFSEMMAELCRDTQLMDTGLNIVCETEPDIWFVGDRNRLKQTLRVFIDNAVKFTEQGGMITLKLKYTEDNSEHKTDYSAGNAIKSASQKTGSMAQKTAYGAENTAFNANKSSDNVAGSVENHRENNRFTNGIEASVQDSGIGIPEKDLPNIFDRFYRVDEARERNSGGHGLGLSIARIIVLRHGGKITVASKVGVGTRFTIKLPLKQ